MKASISSLFSVSTVKTLLIDIFKQEHILSCGFSCIFLFPGLNCLNIWPRQKQRLLFSPQKTPWPHQHPGNKRAKQRDAVNSTGMKTLQVHTEVYLFVYACMQEILPPSYFLTNAFSHDVILVLSSCFSWLVKNWNLKVYHVL